MCEDGAYCDIFAIILIFSMFHLYNMAMKKAFPAICLCSTLLALGSCGGSGSQSSGEDGGAPDSLTGWALVFDSLDQSTSIRDIQCLILSEQSGLLSINGEQEFVDGLTFTYLRDGNTDRGRLVITEQGRTGLTITLQMVFDEYHPRTEGVGTTAIGYLQQWSYVEENGVNKSGTTGRFTGRRQK